MEGEHSSESWSNNTVLNVTKLGGVAVSVDLYSESVWFESRSGYHMS
jgi:hypothetical protein